MSGPTTTPFPTTSNAYRQSNAGSTDVFVSKLNATASTLLYSTYLGGSADDHGYGIAADAAGAVYVTGATGAAFPSTTTSLEHVMGGGTDAFVLRLLTVAGPGLTWNTSLSALPQALSRPAVAVGPDGALYAFGGTDGQNHDYASTYIYHPITATWTVGASMPISREGAQAVTLPDGRIAVLGGAIGCELSHLCSTGTV